VWAVAEEPRAQPQLTYTLTPRSLRAQGPGDRFRVGVRRTKEWRLETSEDFQLATAYGSSLSSRGRNDATPPVARPRMRGHVSCDVYALSYVRVTYCAAFA